MEYVKLEKIIEQIRGVSYKPIDVCDKNTGIPVLTASNIQDDKIILEELIYVNSNKIKSEQILQKNDILICASSGSKSLVGKAGVFASDTRCSFGAFCKVVRLKDKENIVQNYLNCFFRSNIYRTQISEMSQGANINNIKTENIDALKIPLPPKDQQQKIATHLDKITAAINNKKKQLALFDELVKSNFVEMFGDPVTNEMGWENKYLTDFATTRLGKMLDKKKQTGKSSFPYLANFNVQWFRFDFSELHQMDFFEEDQKEFELLDGDLLVCEGGEIGRCAVWHNEIQPCYFQKALHRVRCDKTIADSTYLAYWFKFNCEKNAFDGLVGASATIPHLTGEKLKSLQIPLPPLPLQNQFTEFVQKCDRAKSTVKQEITCLQELLDSKMQDFFGNM